VDSELICLLSFLMRSELSGLSVCRRAKSWQERGQSGDGGDNGCERFLTVCLALICFYQPRAHQLKLLGLNYNSFRASQAERLRSNLPGYNNPATFKFLACDPIDLAFANNRRIIKSSPPSRLPCRLNHGCFSVQLWGSDPRQKL
jgi:hypothetical protein